jgi:hypothetical protein
MNIKAVIEATKRDERAALERCHIRLERRDYPEAILALHNAASRSAAWMALETIAESLENEK